MSDAAVGKKSPGALDRVEQIVTIHPVKSVLSESDRYDRGCASQFGTLDSRTSLTTIG